MSWTFFSLSDDWTFVTGDGSSGAWGLVEATSENQALFEICCCGSGCTCASWCAAPWFRAILSLPGVSDCEGTPGGPCFKSAVYTGTLTEYFAGDPEFSPDPQPASVPIERYWRVVPDFPCADPSDPLIEFCCVSSDKKKYIRLSGIGWRDVSGVGCERYVNAVDNTDAEIGLVDDNDGCCGTWTLEIGCGAMPAEPECDLVGTGPGT